MKRILIAGLFHETHTFLDGRTSLNDFQISRGEEILSAEGDASPMAGLLETARECGWEVVPAIDMRAVPSAMVDDEVVETWWSEFEQAADRAAREKLDGIFLVLHGAMASESLPDVEGELLQRIRDRDDLRDLPLGGVTDLHVNFSPQMAACSNALVTYRENPHTDAKETAVRAARILDEILTRVVHATTLFERPPLMWPPTGTGTADEPMLSLERMAREIESTHEDILAVNVHAGFSFADTPHTGVSFSAVTVGDHDVARAQLRRLSEFALANREAGNTQFPPIEDVMAEVKEFVSAGQTPVILVEPADNIGGGAPGDCTGVLRTLLKHNVQNSAVVLNDPQAVQKLQEIAPGEKLTLPLGGNSGPLSGGPVELEVELVSTSDGRFDLEDPHSHLASMRGLHIKMGPCAVVRQAGISILLTSLKTAPLDLGQLRSQGLVPEELSVIAAKAAVAHRRAYDPIAKASFTVNTLGPCSSDLHQFPFKLVQRPVFPLDGNI